MRKTQYPILLAFFVGIALLSPPVVTSAVEHGQSRLADQGTAPDPAVVPQDPKRAQAIHAILQQIELPPGFAVELYALVPGARHMAVGKTLGVVFVGTRTSELWSVTDRNRDGVAEEVRRFAPALSFEFPNGVAFSGDGVLYLAEHNRLLAFPAAESFYRDREVAVETVAAQLIPPEDEHFNHAFRVIAIGPDDKLYITIGQPYNVWPRDQPFRDPLGTIIRMDRDGSAPEVYARGVRNSVGLGFHPLTGELWFNDNQVDGMGPDIPPGELNRAPEAGMHFGFPWYGGGATRTHEWKDADPPAGVTNPVIEWQAHTANLGMTFYTGTQFPERYRNGLFVAQHGSWNREQPVGAQVMHVEFDAEGNARSHDVFASGWLDEKTGEYLGRPVDVVELADGSLLVSDDFTGAIYRIHYAAER